MKNTKSYLMGFNATSAKWRQAQKMLFEVKIFAIQSSMTHENM